MRTSRRFQHSEQWLLEDRIALSGAGATAEVATAAALRAVVHGMYTTTTTFGVDTENATSQISDAGQTRRFGPISVSGSLSNNIVFPSHKSQTTGTLTVTSPTQDGSATLDVTGAYANLAPTKRETIRLTFTIENATGAFKSLNGRQGTIILTLDPSGTSSGTGLPQTHVSHGNDTMVIKVS